MNLGVLTRIVLLVRDFARSMQFYEGVLGLAKVEERPGWAVFRTGDIMLCLRGPWDGMPFNLEATGQAPDGRRIAIEERRTA